MGSYGAGWPLCTEPVSDPNVCHAKTSAQGEGRGDQAAGTRPWGPGSGDEAAGTRPWGRGRGDRAGQGGHVPRARGRPRPEGPASRWEGLPHGLRASAGPARTLTLALRPAPRSAPPLRGPCPPCSVHETSAQNEASS